MAERLLYKVNKSGRFEIRSDMLKKKGFKGMPAGYNGLPTYLPVPEHEGMKNGDLHLTTYKVSVQTHSRTQNCKYLSEIYHDNPAWIHPKTAAARGIKDGDQIRVKSQVGEIVTKAKVTEGIHPAVVAISYHCGHWQYGRYASGKMYSFSQDSPEDKLKVWQQWDHGMHPNWAIPNSPDPIGGQQRWMDTVITVEKV